MKARVLVAFALVVLACSRESQQALAKPQQVQKGILVVEYRDGTQLVVRDFFANGRERGKTNTAVRMAAGTYTITLGPVEDYTPAEIDVEVEENGKHHVAFKKASAQ